MMFKLNDLVCLCIKSQRCSRWFYDIENRGIRELKRRLDEMKTTFEMLALQGYHLWKSGINQQNFQSKVDLDGASAAAAPQTVGNDAAASGPGAQAGLPEKSDQITSEEQMVQFLRTFGIIIDANSPYTYLQTQMAISELVNFFETVNRPEVRCLNAKERREKSLQQIFNDLLADARKEEAINRSRYLQNPEPKPNITMWLVNRLSALISKKNKVSRNGNQGYLKKDAAALRKTGEKVVGKKNVDANRRHSIRKAEDDKAKVCKKVGRYIWNNMEFQWRLLRGKILVTNPQIFFYSFFYV